MLSPLESDQYLLGFFFLVFIGLLISWYAFKRGFYHLPNPFSDKTVWGNSSHFWFFNWSVGALTWVIVYPWVVAVNQLITFLLLVITGSSTHVDQLAVKQVKAALSNNWLLSATAITVIVIVPIVEEILFRGLLQMWLKKICGQYKAIIITSVAFASFHFSTSQGVGNIEFLLSLFILSCYLGFIRERQSSLWASIGLHSTFNLVSFSLILMSRR